MAIDVTHPDYQANIVTWNRNRDFYNGNDAIKEKGKVYLPATEFDGDDDYNVYLQRAPFFPATARTVEALSGLASRKPSTVTVNDDFNVNDHLPRNMSKEVFEQYVDKELLIVSRIGFLIDKELNDPLADEDSKARINLYTAETIINWRYDIHNKPTLVVFKELELHDDPKDPYTLIKQVQYRECFINDSGFYEQRIWVKSDKQDEFKVISTTVPLNKGEALSYIPFIMLNTTKAGPVVEKAPMTDLVTTNKFHYQTSADNSYIQRKICIPTVILFGIADDPEEPFVMGGAKSVNNEDARVELIEVKGTGVKFIVEQLESFKKEMATLGSKLLDNTRMNETAETVSAFTENVMIYER